MVNYFMTSDALLMKKNSLKDIITEMDCCSETTNKKKKEIDELEELLKTTKEKIKILRKEMENYVSSLREMNLKKKSISKMVENVNLIEVIVVDDERNKCVSNGLVDLNRYVLMKLLRIIQNEEKTRIV